MAHPIHHHGARSTPYTLTLEQVAHPIEYTLTLQQVAHPIHSLQDPIRSPPSVKQRPRFMHTPSEFLEKLNVLLLYVTLNHNNGQKGNILP